MGLNQEEDLFSVYLSEDCFDVDMDDGCLSMKFSDENLDGFQNFRTSNWKMGESQEDNRREEADKGVENIADLLPKDPFNMEFSATVTAITGWIEDLEKDLGLKSLGFVDTDEVEVKKVDNQLFAEVNFVWNGSLRLHSEFREVDKNSLKAAIELENGLSDGHLLLDGEIEEIMGFSYEKYRISSDVANKHESCTEDYRDGDGGSSADGEIEEIMRFSYEKYQICSDAANKHESCTEDYRDGDGGSPAYAFLFALGYLKVEDLLSVERVCKELCNIVRDDPLLWRNIHIDPPLSYKINDDALLRLTDRAQGTVQSLSLVECLNITDTGLKHVLQRNPGLTKLSVPGCIRLSVDGILHNLKTFKTIGMPGIRHLRIGGIFGVTNQHFQELKHLLGAENHQQSSGQNPRLYSAGQLYLSFDDERAIDIETCPRCQELRQVYDCPAESCRAKHQSAQLCRACILCIARCINCGRCLSNCDYEETFCLELLCLDCKKQFLDFQGRSAGITTTSPMQTILHQRASYHFYLCG